MDTDKFHQHTPGNIPPFALQLGEEEYTLLEVIGGIKEENR